MGRHLFSPLEHQFFISLVFEIFSWYGNNVYFLFLLLFALSSVMGSKRNFHRKA